jgi:catechol 2,3-dioxygenase-like lactoylglutathione lyase family enzyme
MNMKGYVELSEMKAVHSQLDREIPGELSVKSVFEGFAVTPLKYQIPLTIETQIKTDSNNIRIKFAKGMVIFNWEVNEQEMRWQNPATGEWLGTPHSGQVPINEWITVTWTIEADCSIVFVDGKERLRVNGDFRGVAGQVGIGTAFDAKVTIRAIKIKGETTEEGIEIVSPPRFRWDGGFIYVNYEKHKDAIRWYSEHLGLKLHTPTWEGQQDPDSIAEKMSSLAFPAGGLIHLKSVSANASLKHFPSGDNRIKSNVGFTFNSPDLYATHRYFLEHGCTVGNIINGPDGSLCFTLEGFDGIKLIIREENRIQINELRISSYGPWYVIVPELEEAIKWYTEKLETDVIRIVNPGKCVEMKGNYYLISNPAMKAWEQHDPKGSPYFYAQNIVEEQQRLKLMQTDVSEVIGTGWKAMHIHDPYGNRINFWSY